MSFDDNFGTDSIEAADGAAVNSAAYFDDVAMTYAAVADAHMVLNDVFLSY